MSLIVQKFGGTSVGSPERIRSVASRIQRVQQQGHSLVVVVSAMGHTTDELIDLAHQVSPEPPHREMDMLLTAGERISMALLSMALADLGVDAVSLTGSQSGIITDGSHRRARIKRILGDRVRAGIAQGKVVIVAGFQGVSESKEITTLGRGGSDTTAVALAAALGAERCDIYTDVNGVYSADPRVVPEAKHWKRIPHDLMVELATRGAGVLHPRSVELARQFGVSLFVKNSLEGEGKLGTEVVAVSHSQRGMEEFGVAGVTADGARELVLAQGVDPAGLKDLWSFGAQQHLSVVAPAFTARSDGKLDLAFFIEREAHSEWLKALENSKKSKKIAGFSVDEDQVPVSVVGDRFSQDSSLLSQVIETLAQSGISVTMGAASALAMTVAVHRSKKDDAVRALHARLMAV